LVGKKARGLFGSSNWRVLENQKETVLG